ncbi:MAG: MarR family transcriptional regulator [Flavobacteriaceae bacterium]|nr:MarR family transcriptional regulator [Flavobacteriaceae bacterium]
MGDISKDIQSTFPNNKVKAFINIRYTANWLASKEIEFLKAYGISPQQYNILRILRGAGQKVKVQTVKDKMIERSPNATRLMDKLCEKDLILRVRCEEDRRVVFVAISEAGLKLLHRIDQASKPEYLRNLNEEEAQILSELLDKIR